MAVYALTQRFVRQARLPSGCRKMEYCDQRVRGLYLEVRSQHRPGVFYFRSRNRQGQRSYYRLGSADALRLEEARRSALALQRQQTLVRLQIDPSSILADEPATRVTLADFFEQQALPHMQKHKRSWKTDRQFWKRHILPDLGEQPLYQIRLPQLREWHQKLQERSLKPASCDRVLVSLKSVFSLAVQWDLLKENPAQRLKLLHQDESRERFLSLPEIKRLDLTCQHEANRSAALVIQFLLVTGARVGEALKARWQDLDLHLQQWTIPAAHAKSKKSRTLPLNRRALEVVNQVKQLPLRRRKSTDVIFVSRKGHPFRDINYTWRKVREAAQLEEVRLHDLRHTYASLLINAGRSLYEVQQLLGHSSSAMTQRYAHLTPSTLRSANDSLDAWLDMKTSSEGDPSS